MKKKHQPNIQVVCPDCGMGKDEARTLRAYLRDLLRAGGIPDERTHEIL